MNDRTFASILFLAIAAGHAFAQPSPWIRTNGPYGGDIRSIAIVAGNTVFAAAQVPGDLTRVYKSTDSGTSWSEIQGAIGTSFDGPLFSTPSGLLLSGATGTSFIGTSRSTDGGATWVNAATTFPITSFGADTAGNPLCASVLAGVYRSTDQGSSWNSLIGDLTYGAVTCVTADRVGALYIGNEGFNGQGRGIYKSTDGGSHWIRVSTYSSANVWSLFTTPGGSILAGTQGGGILRSSDGGQSWPAVNTTDPDLNVSSFATDLARNIFVATSSGVFKSTDDGVDWTPAISGLANLTVWSIASSPAGVLLAGTKTSVFRSTDAGSSWIESAEGIASSICTAIAANISGTVIAATDGAGGIYRTTDSGSTWLPASTGLENRTTLSLAAGNDGTFFAGITADTNGSAVFRSTDQGATWTGLNTHMRSLSAFALATGPGNEVVAASTSGNDGTGIYRSTDNGTTWATLTTGLANVRFYSVTITKSDFIYAGYWGGLPVSTNGGATWTDISNGLPYAPIWALHSDSSNNVYAATGAFGVYRLLLGSWYLLNAGVPAQIDEGDIVSLAIDSAGNVYGGSGSAGAYRLPSGSYKWQRYNSGLSDSTVTSICVAPYGLLYAGTNGDGVYRNGGGQLSISLSHFIASISGVHSVRLDWTTVSEINNYGFKVERSGTAASGFTSITASAIPGHGTSTQPHDYSFIDSSADAAFPWYRLVQIDLDGTVHYSNGVRATSATSVSRDLIPTVMQLEQNYPNPFNPQTVIDFAVPTAQQVTLVIFNVLGQRVTTLLDGRVEAGSHRVVWNAAAFPSGTYFYEMRVGTAHFVKRMVLLK